ncbi:hypothetical protein [Cohnella pontilimi]|uniref:hypothetical protein n=1 Tax=Cohnella pontilimi TaxID=2564100 RepID=UPI00145CB04D|nr:hypothetical protein [Cohnella pontilimi]
MNKMTGDKIRNEEDRDDNSPEQERKIKQGQDIEPQAEKWDDETSDREDQEK